jgi:hypothetical protein
MTLGVTVTKEADAHDGEDQPRAVTVTVYLDIEQIEQTAAALWDRPDPAALTLVVLTHELAHALRRHHGEKRASHDRLHEMDAQEDTWRTLTKLLKSPRLTTVSRDALHAMIALAGVQPSAYARFGTHDSLRFDPTRGEPQAWAARLDRAASTLLGEVVSVPVDEGWDDVRVGDTIFIETEYSAVLGPFTVIAGDPPTTVGFYSGASFDGAPTLTLARSGAWAASPFLKTDDIFARRGLGTLTDAATQDLIRRLDGEQPDVDIDAESKRLYEEASEQLMQEMREMYGQPHPPAVPEGHQPAI